MIVKNTTKNPFEIVTSTGSLLLFKPGEHATIEKDFATEYLLAMGVLEEVADGSRNGN